MVVWCSQAARGAHLPLNGSTEEEPPLPFDLSAIVGETENNRLELLQELLDLSMKGEESGNDIKTKLEKQISAKEASGTARGKTSSSTATTTTTTTQVSCVAY